MKFSFFEKPQGGAPIGALMNVDVHGEIRRWTRGFHAALYQQPVPPKTRYAIQPPFPSAPITGQAPEVGPPRPQDFKFVETIKANRISRNLDRIQCYNNKLTYECVWDQADNGQWICIFALDLYEWKNLGDIHNFPPRGCVGSYYTPSQPPPPLASRGTRLVVSLRNEEPLDPFGR